MHTHVALDRTFWPVGDEEDLDPDVQRAQAAFGLAGKSWEDLLEMPRVVILAEAGTGKTHELQVKAEALKAEGHAAFFCRIERRTYRLCPLRGRPGCPAGACGGRAGPCSPRMLRFGEWFGRISI